MKVNQPPGHLLLVVSAFLMFLVTLFAWQAVTIGHLTYTRNAWHGFWGVILGLLTVVFLVNVAAQSRIVEFKIPLPHGLLSLGLAPAIFVFAVIKAITDDNSAWASYAGIVLAGTITFAAWLARKEQKAAKQTPAAPAPPVVAPSEHAPASAEPNAP